MTRSMPSEHRVASCREAAQPLRKPDNGSDVESNVLCPCSNDHVLFDTGPIYIESHGIVGSDDAEPPFYVSGAERAMVRSAWSSYHSVESDISSVDLFPSGPR
jgi:hypothetical protein